MVLASMCLFLQTAHGGSVLSDDNEKILRVEPEPLVSRDDLDMRKTLFVRAHLVLALDDQHAALLKNPIRFDACLQIHVNDGIMPFSLAGAASPIRVVVSKRGVRSSACHVTFMISVEPLHVRRIENDAIDAFVRVGQISAIDSCAHVYRA